MDIKTISRQECINHFHAIKAINEAGPESEWFEFKGENDTNSAGLPYATHATLDATTFNARKAEVKAAAAGGQSFIRRVVLLNGEDHYHRLVRFTQYACTSARSGKLVKALKLVYDMDVEFFKDLEGATGPEDVCGMTLLMIVSWALYGPERALDLLGDNVEKILKHGRFFIFGRDDQGNPGVSIVQVHKHIRTLASIKVSTPRGDFSVSEESPLYHILRM